MGRRVAWDLVLTSKARQFKMNMGIDKARYHNAPFGIESGYSPRLSFNLGVRAHHNDSPIPDKCGFRVRLGSIHGYDATID